MRGVAPLHIWSISVTCLSSIFLTCLSATTMTRLQTVQDTWRADAAAAVREVIQVSSRGDISLIVIADKSSSGEVNSLLGTSRGVALFAAPPNSSSRLAQVVAGARQVRWLSWMVVVVVLSDDPAFLAAFARQSREGPLLVWATRLIVVTHRAPPRLHPLHQTLSITNSLLLVPDVTEDVQSSDHGLRRRRLRRVAALAFLPFRSSSIAPLLVSSWTAGRGLTLHRPLFFDKFNKSYGKMNLLVGMERGQRHSVVMLRDPTAPGGVRLHFKGYMVNFLDYLTQTLNFS